MKYTPYSFSKVQKHVSCPAAFKYRYIDHVKVPRVPSLPLERGSLLHGMMEHGTTPEAIDIIKQDWQIKNATLLTPNVWAECKRIVTDFKQSEVGLWYESLTSISKEAPIALDKTLKPVQFDHHYGKGALDNLYQGFVDDVSVLEEKNLLVITDWKSGRIPDAPKWDQLMYYAIWAFEEVPYDNILLCYTYIEHNKRVHQLLKREDLNKYKIALVKSIKVVEADETFEKNVTDSCKWCDYQDICKPHG